MFLPKRVFASDEEEYLEQFKNDYRGNSYFEYVPSDAMSFDLLPENEIIAEFAGIKVTKKLLDEETYMLDIDKVTLEDLVNNPFDLNNPSTYQLILPGEGGSSITKYRSISSGYTSAVVTTKELIISGDDTGLYSYTVYAYLSNNNL